ncbi:type II secretion system F family protein [Haloarcula nitratireducens]|uniref:Type II secretion system protein n=1 Tax=Haloarcula nitratireducens TaxID=2487749 RepID=A0AAW4P776_9EURY|nr:type II secretion system protein [Halomicroarcula nitratireducens]MBX0293473.1 type II secretion system protein [Halomicroarcula nitratireducens]
MTERAASEGLRPAWDDFLTVPTEYERACRFLGVDRDPARLLGASYALAVGFWLAGLAVLSVGTGGLAVLGGGTCLLAAVGVALAGRYGVPLAARARRVRALGAAPSLVVTLVLGVTLWPSAERATVFATAASDGLLADRLRRHRLRARGTARSGVRAFAAAWDDQFPALGRAVRCVERAAVVPAAERAAVRSTARRYVLDGTREEMARFAADLRAPATGLYAFGVLLPLAFVSLLPAAAAAGVAVTPTLLALTYGVGLPSGLVVASGWLLARRPVAFPPATVPRSHPDVPSTPTPALLGGGLAAVFGWLVGHSVVPGWGTPITALGAGAGTALVVHYRPVRQVRERVTAVEETLPDALSAIGRRVDRGLSVEAAIAETAEVTADPLAALLDATLARQQRLGCSVESAFRGDHGALDELPSPRLRQAATLLDAAASIGPPAGDSVATMGDHLDELAAVERETRRDLAQITGTLSNTGALFGPLVGGATVALAESMRSGGPIEAVSAGHLGPVVGWYCLVLAAVLTALSTGLHRGLDRALVGYRVGLALCSATAVYLVAVVATRLLV